PPPPPPPAPPVPPPLTAQPPSTSTTASLRPAPGPGGPPPPSGKPGRRFLGLPVWLWVLGVIAGLVILAVLLCVFWLCKEDPPEPSTGQVRIDANPWGDVQWIRTSAGGSVDLSGETTTPFLRTLPAGSYEARVIFPPSGASGTCELRVRVGELATCWLDLEPVDSEIYMETIGW
ncbi:MAG: hypothetical protein AAGD06_21495, partial [Acidobacteriota bacterium]